MQGVVVFCDGIDGSAVIWCEDHAELAYCRGQDTVGLAWPPPKVGDLVQFRVAEKSGLRFAQAVRVIMSDAMPDLAHAIASTIARATRQPPVRLRRVG